jgi:lactate 2-monooxygenase
MFGRPLTWGDLAWPRSLTTLPIVLKGICHSRPGRDPAYLSAAGIVRRMRHSLRSRTW